MSTLQIRIDEIALSFAREIVHTIRTTPLKEILSAAFDEERVPAGDPSVASSPSASPAEKTGFIGNPRGRRTSTQVERDLSLVVSVLKAHEGGLRAEELRLQLMVPSSRMRQALRAGSRSGLLRAMGRKRGTRYFACQSLARRDCESSVRPGMGQEDRGGEP